MKPDAAGKPGSDTLPPSAFEISLKSRLTGFIRGANRMKADALEFAKRLQRKPLTRKGTEN
jgi:hypothetical protein